MKATFLVELEVGDDTDFHAIAHEIHEDLLDANHAVSSVKPWARNATKNLLPVQQAPTVAPSNVTNKTT